MKFHDDLSWKNRKVRMKTFKHLKATSKVQAQKNNNYTEKEEFFYNNIFSSYVASSHYFAPTNSCKKKFL